ncbi:MAG: 4Fe-4S dicluster domain-containing protein [Bariatricus sp.]
MKIDLDTSRCCACGACAVACMDQNDTDTANGMHPFRSVFRDEWGDGIFPSYFSIACMHCKEAPCVLACPCGCLYKDEETGLTLYNNDCCIGCHSCAMACPFGAPAFGPDGKMNKCDGCIQRLRAGMAPACVRACAFGALQLVSKAEDEIMPEHSLSYLCGKLVKKQK